MEILHKIRNVSEKIRKNNLKFRKFISNKQSQRDTLISKKTSPRKLQKILSDKPI